MSVQSARTGPNLAAQAVTAGILGGVLVDLFLIAVRAAPFPGIYQYIASGIVGEAAYASSSYIALGVVIHLAISIAAALAYAYLGRALGLLQKWLLGGTIFGIVMLVVMQIVLALAHLAQPLTPARLAIVVIAHVVFFGLPIAWYVSRAAPAA